jgi:hypothetical protein
MPEDLFEDSKGTAAPPAGVIMPPNQIIQAAPPTTPPKPKFEFTPTKKGAVKHTYMIYGDPKTGKTMVMEAFAGDKDRMDVISMDNQSSGIWENFYDSTEQIQIWDGVKYYIEDPAALVKIPESGLINFTYIMELLNEVIAKNPPDWIAVDGLSIAASVAEQIMRYNHSLGPTDGFKERNWWKERGFHLRTLHRTAFNIAKKGVIYTTYGEFQIEEVERGETVKGKVAPKWFDVIMQETEFVIHTFTANDKVGKMRFFYQIESSKYPKILPKTGPIDITDKKIILPFGGKFPGQESSPQVI